MTNYQNIFPSKNPYYPLPQYVAIKTWKEFLKETTKNSILFHDLRHYSASIRHALGIPDAYIMEEGGWCSDKVLKAVYRHAMSDRKKEMAAKANSHFESLF